MNKTIVLLIGLLVALAYIFTFKAYSLPLSFSHKDESSKKISFGFRLDSESEASPDDEKAHLVYMCADYREQMYFVFPSQLRTSEVSSLIFKFDNDELIKLGSPFLRKSNDNKAYFLMYGASTFDGNQPVRTIYRELQRASNLALYTSGDSIAESIAYLFDLEGTSAAMRKANTEGECDMTHLWK